MKNHPHTMLALGIILIWGGFWLVSSSVIHHSHGLGALSAVSTMIGGAAIMAWVWREEE